jgi:hypothetical protein
MKIILQTILLLLTTISCSRIGDGSIETLLSLGLLGFRQTATVDGTFFGIYNANVKAVALGNDGKCKSLSTGDGDTVTSSKGEFSISYKRFSETGGNVCIMAYPKEDGTSRFFAVDQQREINWTGQDKYQILVMPEPSTTKRSEFSVVSTPFNRMAVRRLERLASGNADPSKTGEYLKTANRQIVSQFGLSRGISKNAKASSIELATPELTSLKIDFSNPSDPETLKFIIMIGGLHKLAIPEKPETYEDVVSVVSEYLSSGTGSSVSEDGKPLLLPKDKTENGGSGRPLSEGNSLSTQVATAVNTFLVEKAAELGISASAVAQIAAQIVVQDKPSFGPTAPPSQEKLYPPTVSYNQSSVTYSIFDKFSLIPNYKDANYFTLKTGSSEPVFPPGMSLNSTTGEITWEPTDAIIATYLEPRNFDFKIIASGKGGDTVTPISIELVPRATINIMSNNNCVGTTCKYNTGSLYIKLQTTGTSSLTGSGTLPSGVTFNSTTREFVGSTPGTCSNCSYTVVATDKMGGTTSLTITLLETPTFTFPYATYRFIEGENINLQISNIRATNSFAIATTPLNNSITVSNSGLITGIPVNTDKNVINVKVTAIGNSGTILEQTFKLEKSPGAPICRINNVVQTNSSTIQMTQFNSSPTIVCSTASYTEGSNLIPFNALNSTWNVLNLPNGLTTKKTATSLEISGTPKDDTNDPYNVEIWYTTLSGASQTLKLKFNLSNINLGLDCKNNNVVISQNTISILASANTTCTANINLLARESITNWKVNSVVITKNDRGVSKPITGNTGLTSTVVSNGSSMTLTLSPNIEYTTIISYEIEYTNGSNILKTMNSGDYTYILKYIP